MAVQRIVDDPAAAAASIAAGGRLLRHSVLMVLDLALASPAPLVGDGFSIAPMSPDRVIEYGEVVSRAYPPEHPDHEPADSDPESAAQAVLEVMRGETMGPWIAGASLHVADHTDRIVGQILVSETTASDTSVGGPFVTDVCVDPAVAGHRLGAALLAASAGRLVVLGWSALTLVVTVGNPAQRVYARLGFRVTAESWRIETAARSR
ncbi:MAG: GNAT family N-acetyltransferase [Terracoccus sp.]